MAAASAILEQIDKEAFAISVKPDGNRFTRRHWGEVFHEMFSSSTHFNIQGVIPETAVSDAK